MFTMEKEELARALSQLICGRAKGGDTLCSSWSCQAASRRRQGIDRGGRNELRPVRSCIDLLRESAAQAEASFVRAVEEKGNRQDRDVCAGFSRRDVSVQLSPMFVCSCFRPSKLNTCIYVHSKYEWYTDF